MTASRAAYRAKVYAELEQLYTLLTRGRVGVPELQRLLSMAGGELRDGLRQMIFDLKAGRIGSTEVRLRMSRSGRPQGGHTALPEAVSHAPQPRALSLADFQREVMERFYLRPRSTEYEQNNVPFSLLLVTLQRRSKLTRFHTSWQLQREAADKELRHLLPTSDEEREEKERAEAEAAEPPVRRMSVHRRLSLSRRKSFNFDVGGSPKAAATAPAQPRRHTRRVGVLVDVYLWGFDEARRNTGVRCVARGKAVRALRGCGDCFLMTDVFGDADAVSIDPQGPVTEMLFPRERGALSEMEDVVAHPVEWSWGCAVRNLDLGDSHGVMVSKEHVYSWGLEDQGQFGHATLEVPVREGLRAPTATDAARIREASFLSGGAFQAAKHEFNVKAQAAETEWATGLRGGATVTRTRELEESVAEAWEAMLRAGGPRVVPALDGVHVTSVACGPGHTVALARAGVVYSWGLQGCGRLGRGGDGRLEAPPLGVGRVGLPVAARQVACGATHSAALLDGGQVFTWGGNQFGQLGQGEGASDDCVTPTEAPLPSPGAQVVCGADHTVVRLENGGVVAAGSNWSGEAGQPQSEPLVFAFSALRLPQSASRAAHVAACEDATAVLTSGNEVLICGMCALPSQFEGVGELRSVFGMHELPLLEAVKERRRAEGLSVGESTALRQVACVGKGWVAVTAVP